MKRIYVLHPGQIRGYKGIKFYDAHDLIRLYKVEAEECVVYKVGSKYQSDADVEYFHLRPRGDRNYTLG